MEPPLQDQKPSPSPSFASSVQQRLPKKMIVSSSSRPVRALVIVLFLVLIYYLQPFTATTTAGRTAGGGGDDSLRSSSSSLSSPWPHWPHSGGSSASSKKTAADAPHGFFNPGEGGPRIRQATMIYDTDKFNAVYERSVDSHINHGKLWNYPTHILRHDVVDAGFFNKPAFLLGLVIQEMAKSYGERADWIVWFDADTVILNPNVPWSLFLPPADFDDIHILGSRDQNGFNAGMMLLRVHEWTVKMLSEVIALRQLRPEVEFPFYDQGATRWVCERPGYEEHLLYQPHDWWNAFGLSGEPYNTDRFMLHFAGVDCCGQPEKKTVVIGRWLDIVENHPEKHTTPLANTTYPAQVESYWKLLKNAKSTQSKADKWKEETGAKSTELDNAQKELKQIVMRNADKADEMKEAIKKVDALLSKSEGAKPADNKKAEEKDKGNKSDEKPKGDDKSKKPNDKGKKDEVKKEEGKKNP